MGLDVYLYKCPDRATANKAEADYEAYSETLWDKHPNYEDFTQAEKDEIRALEAAKRAELGMSDYYHASRVKVEIDSAKYPEHYFKIGYFRSSYNGGGINNVMKNHGYPGLYDLFPGEHDGDDAPPDWAAVRASVVKAIADYGAFLQTPQARRHIIDAEFPLFDTGKLPTSERQALELFEKSYHDTPESEAYSSGVGLFFPEPVKLLGAIPARKYGKWSVTFLIFDSDPTTWYLQALEIVLETIDYVLAQPDSETYYLHWSG